MPSRSPSTGRFVKTEAALKELAINHIIPEIQRVLKEQDRVASGKLLNSFVYEVNGNVLDVYSTESYAGSVDVGKSPGDRPPQSQIVRWAQEKGIRPRYLFGSRAGKFMPLRTWAYYVANKIEREGYLGSDYIGESFLRYQDEIESSVGEAMAQDIAEMLDNNISLM